MNEPDWNACTDPAPMLQHLSGLVSEATFRFFLLGCCRRVAHLLRDRRSLDAMDIGESFARGIASAERLAAAREAAEQAAQEAAAAAQEAEPQGLCSIVDAETWRELDAASCAARAAVGLVAPNAEAVACQAASAAADAAATIADAPWEEGQQEEQAAQCSLLRELVGWPIRSAFW